MAELAADFEPCLLIQLSLFERQRFRVRPACCRRRPSRQFFVSALCVGMPQPVHPGHTGTNGLALVDPELLPVISIAGNQRALAGVLVSAIEHSPLQRTADWDGSRLAALGPGSLQLETIGLVGIAWAELDRFLPPQPKRLLQHQAHSDVCVPGLLEVAAGN